MMCAGCGDETGICSQAHLEEYHIQWIHVMLKCQSFYILTTVIHCILALQQTPKKSYKCMKNV